jgi:hypothetical protein
VKRVVLLVVALGVLAAFAVWRQVGSSGLPKDHRLTRAGRFPATRAEAWSAVRGLDGEVAWRTDLDTRSRLPDVRGHAVWRETWPDGESVSWETVELQGDRRIVRCVVDQDGPFGGCWTIEVAPRDDQSVVTVTEQLTVHDAWYARTHDVASRQARLDAFLRALGGPLGTPALADAAKDLREPVAR